MFLKDILNFVRAFEKLPSLSYFPAEAGGSPFKNNEVKFFYIILQCIQLPVCCWLSSQE